MVQAISVGDMTRYLTELVASDDILADIWIRGEVCNYRPQPNARYRYFSLKDANAQLNCAIFRTLWNTDTLREGMMIQAHGRLDIYAVRGTYSLIVDEFEPLSERGLLFEQLEQLKQRLSAEGLFAEERKRPLPTFPLRVGVVTSPDTAAFQDVRHVFARRFPMAHLIVSPTLVQGSDAPPQIVRAIERFYTDTQVDVVLVCRGGGSVEDLWCFNDERVVRALAACPVPVITGVGHEIDYTLVDFVADQRAPTPSAAAELLTPDIAALHQDMQDMHDRLEGAYSDSVAFWKDQLVERLRTLAFYSPQRAIDTQRRRTDDLQQQLSREMAYRLQLTRERLSARTQALEAANPQALLRRGYAMVTDEHGGLVTHISQALINNNRQLTIQLQDGTLLVTVEGASYDNPR